MDSNTSMSGEFKPNAFPILYWALAYGVVAAVIMFLLTLFAQFITLLWPLVFLMGLMWGAYRNWKRQKQQWETATGTTSAPQSVQNEFRAAVSDIAVASRELLQTDGNNPPQTETPPPAPAAPTTDTPTPQEPGTPNNVPPDNEPTREAPPQPPSI